MKISSLIFFSLLSIFVFGQNGSLQQSSEIPISTHSQIDFVPMADEENELPLFHDFQIKYKLEEPNDSFRKQLVGNAKAAIDAVDQMGYIDRKKVAVGGHSYGAFMVANLLSHSDLFAAGIARSGAYNRTLTPFAGR